jgi:inosose dehydratase
MFCRQSTPEEREMPELRFGYAINQWNCPRRDQQERAFKVMSACGFHGVELRAGSGRWSPLGKADLIELNFGSVNNFREFAASFGVQVASFYYDPLMPLEGEDSEFWRGAPAKRSPLNSDDHERTVAGARSFAKLLSELGGTCLVVPPVPPYWMQPPLTDDQISTAATCWNKVGKMTKQDYNVTTALHVDCLSALRSPDALGKLMEHADPAFVGLAIDTAELTIAGINPVDVYDTFHDRVKHFHFKDTRNVDALEEYKKPFADFHLLDQGGGNNVERWFWEMGTPGGLVNFPALVKSMKKHNYDGWVIAESDPSPNPAQTALLNAWYAKSVLAKI